MSGSHRDGGEGEGEAHSARPDAKGASRAPANGEDGPPALARGLAGPGGDAPRDRIMLDHDGRALRRRLLTGVAGLEVLVDLPGATLLRDGDRLALEGGGTVEIVAAEEDLTEIRADDAAHLTRLAWHLGNRHLPTQIAPDRLLIRRDPVIERMLVGQGARIAHVRAAFSPEGGAYAADHAHGRG